MNIGEYRRYFVEKIKRFKNVGMWGCGGEKYMLYRKIKKIYILQWTKVNTFFIFLIENGGIYPHIPTNA